MPPGNYLVRCTDAKMAHRGRATQVVLTFNIEESAWNDGTELKQWYNLPRSGRVSAHSKYAEAWQLASGQEMKPGDDMNPSIFVGKLFQAYVGFRSNGPGNVFDKSHTETKKGEDDFVRVHSLERRVEEKP